MSSPSEFACGDTSKDYCVHCARPDGTMQSFEEKRAGLTAFIVKTQGFDEAAALKTSESMMKKLPAWAAYFEE
jgi:hypothetical protein